MDLIYSKILYVQVLNEANLTNAVLVRTVLTRSDLGGAIIDGADFSDAVLDLTTKQVMLKFCIKGSAAVGATGVLVFFKDWAGQVSLPLVLFTLSVAVRLEFFHSMTNILQIIESVKLLGCQMNFADFMNKYSK
jgi:Pentapeptide repeats (8 copies)